MIIMRIRSAIAILAAALLAGSCGKLAPSYRIFGSQIVDYQINDNTYAVVVPEDEGVSKSQAVQFAKQKAAEITVSNGGRYFTIQSEQQTQMIKSNKDWPSSQDVPGNMYQELIIEGNFGRDSIQRNSPPTSSIVPAYRLVFQIHEKKPLMQRSIDACTLTDCESE